LATQTLPETNVAGDYVPGHPPLSFLDLRAQFAAIREEVLFAVSRVLDSQHFILGSEVETLERDIAAYVGAQFAIGCASGSDALLLAMMALGIDHDAEVVTTPFTFGATAGAIARLKARPVFIDIDKDTFNLNVAQLEAAITPKTRAVLPVHLFGLPADMDSVLRVASGHGLEVIEDAAQSIGSRYNGQGTGSLGTFGCFSFFPSKNLGCAGDGGMVTTNDPELAQRVRMMRAHGTRRKYEYECLGINSRLDALQAAILQVKLRSLDQWTSARRRNALRYAELFAERGLCGTVKLPSEVPGTVHVYNQYVIRARQRDELQRHLQLRGIPTEIYYPSPLHLQPAFEWLGYRRGDFPNAELACREVLALPIYPELTVAQQSSVVDGIAEFYNTRAK
jgi:dTDP-4-amino-4,6-dideoxygalactose transaminase